MHIPVVGRDGLTVPEQLVRLPVSLDGIGFRSLEDTCKPAFIGGLIPTAPYLASVPALQEAWGGQGDQWEETDPMDRYTLFLESNLSAAKEFKEAWSSLQVEAREAAEWLGEDMKGPLVQEVQGAGEGSSSRDVRGSIVRERDIARKKILLKALENHHDQSWRPVWSLPERDKLSSAWALCLPHPHTTMSPSEFAQVFSNHLSTFPSVCGQSWGASVWKKES